MAEAEISGKGKDMSDYREARDAFLAALKWQAEEYGSMLDWLNPELGMNGVRLDGTWDFNAAIDAFLSKLSESHAIVPREMTEAMWDAGADLFPSLEEVEKGIHEQGEDIFYEVIPGPSEIWDAMIQAASGKE